MPGTFFAVLSWPMPWPPTNNFLVLASPPEVAPVGVHGLATGQLRVQLGRSTDSLTVETCPITVSGRGLAVLSVVWESTAEIFLNGASLSRARSAQLTLNQLPPGSAIAIDDPEAAVTCAKWVDWRRATFGTAVKAPGDRRLSKPLDRQVSELASVLGGLKDLLDRPDAPQFVPFVSAALRSLVYWDGRQYAPLLLRIAARTASSLPLPVYAVDSNLPGNHVPSYHYTPGQLSRAKIFPAHELMDLQEWLDRRVQISNDPSLILKAKDVVREVASASGLAHFEEHSHRGVETLFDLRTANQAVLTQFLFDAGTVVLDLGLELVRRHQLMPEAVE